MTYRLPPSPPMIGLFLSSPALIGSRVCQSFSALWRASGPSPAGAGAAVDSAAVAEVAGEPGPRRQHGEGRAPTGCPTGLGGAPWEPSWWLVEGWEGRAGRVWSPAPWS
jgi:hypothetical protein